MSRKPTSAEKADIKVAKAASPIRRKASVRAAGTLAEVADQPQLITLCLGVLMLGAMAQNARLAGAGGRMLAAELLATKLKSVIKHRVDRTRPEVMAGGGTYDLAPGHSRDPKRNSFPSGHTAGAVGVARAVAVPIPNIACPPISLPWG